MTQQLFGPDHQTPERPGTNQDAGVCEIRIYPVKGEPARILERADIAADGVVGDRRKKSPVHLVTEADAGTRANLVVSTDPHTLYAAVGHLLRVGAATLSVTTRPSGCPGVYAEVVTPGSVSVGDPVTIEAATAAPAAMVPETAATSPPPPR